MLYQWRAAGYDAGPTCVQHWVDVSCLLCREGITLLQIYHVYQRFKQLKVIQQTRDIDPMLYQCWAIVYDAGPPLVQH